VIFADTGALFAAYVPIDAHAPVARRWLNHNEELLLTTDFVFDELMTLLRSRGVTERAIAFGRRLLEGSFCRFELVTEEDFDAAWLLFQTHRAREWSFTDCTSCAVMRRLGITTAFAFDQHFREMGFEVVPELST